MNDQSNEAKTPLTDGLNPRDSAPERCVWFNVYPALNRITEVKVDKVTDTSVVIGGKRRARLTQSESYEPTLEKAKASLIDWHEMKVSRAATMLKVRERDLEAARNPQVKRIATARETES